MAIIYKITHKESSKSYIGQTKKTLEWRLNNSWCGHFAKATSSCNASYIANAIYKYGKDAFTYEVIEECSKDSLNEREIYWIAHYKSNQREFGYNQTKGGQSNPALFVKASQRMKEYNNNFWSKEENVHKRKLKVSNQFKTLWATDSYRLKTTQNMKGRKHSEEHRRKIQETKIKNGTAKFSEKCKIRSVEANKGNTYVKGRIYIHKDAKVKMIYKESLHEFIDNGWVLGRGKLPNPMSKEGRENISKCQIGRKLTEEQKKSRLDRMIQKGTNKYYGKKK